MSRPVPSLRRPLAALLTAAFLLVGAGCASPNSTPSAYGDTTRRNFAEGCLDGLTSDPDEGESEALSDEEAEEVCGCAYDAIVEEIPFEEFKEINEELSDDPGPLPESITSLVDGCRDQLR